MMSSSLASSSLEEEVVVNKVKDGQVQIQIPGMQLSASPLKVCGRCQFPIMNLLDFHCIISYASLADLREPGTFV